MTMREPELFESGLHPAWVSTTRRTQLFYSDCMDWLALAPDESVHAVVTDPPYGMLEYSPLSSLAASTRSMIVG